MTFFRQIKVSPVQSKGLGVRPLSLFGMPDNKTATWDDRHIDTTHSREASDELLNLHRSLVLSAQEESDGALSTPISC